MSKVLKYGIDISEHQGSFDLSGYRDNFVIIRVAWGENTDKQAIANMDKCDSLGIPYGVYLYDYAVNLQQAQAQAYYVLNLVKGRQLAYGIWLDLEEDGYRTKTGTLNATFISDVARTFLTIVTNANYYCGIYASQSWFGTYIVGCDKWDKWVANWGTNNGRLETDTSNMGGLHQYTSKPLDKNVAYYDYPAIMKANGLSGFGQTPAPKPTPPITQIGVGSNVRVLRAISYDGISLNPSILENTYPVIELSGVRAVLGNGLNTAFNVNNLVLVGDGVSSTTSFKVNDNVIVINNVDVNGTRLATSGTYSVMEVSNPNRIVIGRGGVVSAAMPAANLKKI